MATDAGPHAVDPFAGDHGSMLNADEHDPSFDPTATGVRPVEREDADTCRICRGEGSAEEPLFFPCKCSGSIKYVHQECLMEWLSHSQKKYCELCKTSFRFTKLYHPGMPTRIPTSVFVRRAAIHVLKMLVTWLRGVLVASVWLVCLPWCMRVVWRSLFWVGDGGWSPDLFPVHMDGDHQATSSSALDLDSVRSAIESARAANTSVNLPIPGLFMPFSQTLNMSAGEPTVWTLVKRFFFGFPYPLDLSAPGINATEFNATTDGLGARNPSLLSDISFFNWFPSQAANQFLIDVLEGQIITLLVVVAFILIFLIREWVVQQQPVINMVQLGDEAAAANRIPEVAQIHHVDDEPEEEMPDIAEPAPGEAVNDAPTAVEEDTAAVHPPLARVRRSSSSQRRRQAIFQMWQNSDEIPEELRYAMQNGTPEDVARVIERMPIEESLKLKDHLTSLSEQISNDEPASIHGNPHDSNSVPGFEPPERTSSLANQPESVGEPSSLAPPTPPQRPIMPDRDRSFLATEIRRSLEEGESWSFANATQEGQEEPNHTTKTVPDSWDDEDAEDRLLGKGKDAEQDSEHSSESWQQVPEVVVEENVDQRSDGEPGRDKGKARAVEAATSSGSDVPVSSLQATTADEKLNVTDAATDEGDAPSNLSECGSDSYRQDSDLEDIEVGEQHDSEAEVQVEQVQQPEPIQGAQAPRPLIERIMDWLFGDIVPGVQAAEDGGNDEQIVQDLADEPPFVAAFGANGVEEDNEPGQDPEVAAAAAQAGIDLNDQDAIDDAEDLEGIMELIGMQGPLTGLFQNAMFSAVLISATLACAVWLPYLLGKVVLLVMGSPVYVFVKFPLQVVATLTDVAVDSALCLGASSIFWGLRLVYLTIQVCTWGTVSSFFDGPFGTIAGPAKSIAENSMDRMLQLAQRSSILPNTDTFHISINSHVALRTIQNSTSYALNHTSNAVANVFEKMSSESGSETAVRLFYHVPASILALAMSAFEKLTTVLAWIWNSKSYKITLDLDFGSSETVAYTALEHWTATDRLIAVFAGYAFFAFAGAVYLKRGSPFSTSQQGRKVEGIISDILNQAGGVLKVILIISIEMLAFPLYCGLLLDLALLPLFENANLYTRWQFTRQSPWTSGFVHWFIGTCYMFHFALFVSMCRKIMRRGVLYFIRDPDDPTFHPVRDVLERSVTTQLRKIAFSALVYGALVVVCLGGVVWGLDRSTSGVLPIHWTSQTPSLEFPLDLLFYNFLAPVIIKLYKPSDALHTVSQWWFKACARMLRLSNFLFGDKVKEEEGHHVRRTWTSWLSGEKGNPENPVVDEVQRREAERGDRAYFIFDGRYVRAPASDQARIPKGQPVFVEVDHDNVRKDGKSNEGGIHNSDLVSVVYIPPWFRVRIALFVVTIWVFAAMSGISVTIIPLLFGRYLFSLLLPTTVEMNDIHAFSLGIYTLGAFAYTGYQLYKFLSSLNRPVPSPLSTLYTVAAAASRVSLKVLKFGYVWTSLVFVIPFLFAVIIELYFLMPLHAYLGPSEPHVVHIIQDWTLGFLYARLAARLLFANRASRPARAFSAVVADGYLNPNARIATRCFLLPVAAIFAIAIAFPSSFAWVMNRTLYIAASEQTKSQVWRFSYPAIGLGLATVWVSKEAISMLNRWRMIVRDEVYLIGERLHNFGERRAPANARTTAVRAI
ncbi:hypothetical protein BS50DRAFT_681870 [Corynespora cassiicola Philippines]|uniref:RING-type E3 ubiquitin transferase n=1 Tax=Corynespora cassiicola Philippines TaxID=1448308 RepID=A0A2T2N3Q7_CORCC|nr:hypothetical protein BS50DRAFT_681870 [Corynespora cassiicola Philippines]